ncbi:UDP-N-acetylmuramate:L-alanyl-gamma-D-glutamyl-meso-diaminopimelate ligase, partial [Burkholderia pseudomallei]
MRGGASAALRMFSGNRRDVRPAADFHYAHAARSSRHILIVGICGTFMGGLAVLARAAG